METESLGAQAIYFAFLARQDWHIQQCEACTQHVFYPRQICPHCGHDRLRWVRPRGRGHIYAFSTIAPTREGEPARHVVLVDLVEGVRMMSCVDPCPAAGLRVGDRVTARIEPMAPGSADFAVVFSVDAP